MNVIPLPTSKPLSVRQWERRYQLSMVRKALASLSTAGELDKRLSLIVLQLEHYINEVKG